MASGGSFDEDDFYKRVLMSSQKRFVSDADPVALLDEFLQKEFIDHDLYRDISELTLTSQKNRKIIEIVRTKGKNGYIRFKKCLRESDQGHLADHLERNEKEVKQTARKKPTQTIKKVSDEDLAKVANAIGKNWELLAPALGLIDTEVDHLKMNYDTVELCIYQMLMTWKKRSGEAATLQNLLSKTQSMPSVNVNMDYIYHNVPGAMLLPSYQSFRKNAYVCRPKFVEDMPVEIPESVSQVEENENKHKQIEEQSWTPNTVDGVSPVKERSEEQLQAESHNKSKTMEAEDQIDAVGTDLSKPNKTEVTTSYEHLNVKVNSEASVSVETQPKQVADDLTINKIQSAIDVLSTITASSALTHIPGKENDSKLNQRSNPDTYPGVHLSQNIKVEPPAESNDEISKKKLKERFRPSKHTSRRYSTHDGRLLILERDEFNYVKRNYSTQKPVEGGYGCVYISKEKIPALGIKVAIKEIECSKENKEHYERSIANEKLASRTMHFAIVPLLAMGCDKDKGIYWFLSPCLEKGDLYTLIENDTRRINGHSMEDVELNRQRRLKIIYHISAAIDFLHTEIENFRGRIIHLDVKSLNVVLDPFYNARLTDFGVARETAGNETSVKMTFQTGIPTSIGYFDPPSKRSKLRTYFDYFNIGVVIRELLTGKPPSFKDIDDPENLFLKKMDTCMLEEFYIQGDIWNDHGDLCKPAERMLILSQQCIDCADESETKNENLTSMKILKEMEDVVEQFCDGHAWERSADTAHSLADDNCEMCMVNSSVEKDLLSHANCQCPLKVCVSCMQNSYLNPLRCHTCFREIEPIIGSKWGAVLVAGRYDNDMEFSQSCSKDITDVEKVITSRCPLVIGIRKDFVRTIKHNSSKSSEQVKTFSSRVQSAFDELKQDGVRTLFFYFSGHFSKANDGFIMQTTEEKQYTSEYLLVSEFKEMLRSFSEKNCPTANKIDKNFIIILDCAEAPILGFGLESDAEMYRRIVQLNACGPDQKIVKESDETGSLFKKFFIQGLTMKATKNNCHLMKYEPCDICPIKGDDFITIGSLNTYITRHMEAYYKHFCREPAVPVQYTSRDAKIAYVVDTSAELNFILTFRGMQKDCSIACHFFNEISQLKDVLFDEFMDKMKVDKEKGTELQLSSGDYQDILQIIIKTGPKETHKLERNSLEQIMSAWNGKRELFVEMRDIQTIANGMMVGEFRETEKILSSLHQYEKEEQANRTIYRIDVESFRELKSPELLKLRKGVLALPTEQRKLNELHIILPSMADETGSRRHRDDFVCFKIQKKSSVGNC